MATATVNSGLPIPQTNINCHSVTASGISRSFSFAGTSPLTNASATFASVVPQIKVACPSSTSAIANTNPITVIESLSRSTRGSYTIRGSPASTFYIHPLVKKLPFFPLETGSGTPTTIILKWSPQSSGSVTTGIYHISGSSVSFAKSTTAHPASCSGVARSPSHYVYGSIIGNAGIISLGTIIPNVSGISLSATCTGTSKSLLGEGISQANSTMAASVLTPEIDAVAVSASTTTGFSSSILEIDVGLSGASVSTVVPNLTPEIDAVAVNVPITPNLTSFIPEINVDSIELASSTTSLGSVICEQEKDLSTANTTTSAVSLTSLIECGISQVNCSIATTDLYENTQVNAVSATTTITTFDFS